MSAATFQVDRWRGTLRRSAHRGHPNRSVRSESIYRDKQRTDSTDTRCVFVWVLHHPVPSGSMSMCVCECVAQVWSHMFWGSINQHLVSWERTEGTGLWESFDFWCFRRNSRRRFLLAITSKGFGCIQSVDHTFAFISRRAVGGTISSSTSLS